MNPFQNILYTCTGSHVIQNKDEKSGVFV